MSTLQEKNPFPSCAACYPHPAAYDTTGGGTLLLPLQFCQVILYTCLSAPIPSCDISISLPALHTLECPSQRNLKSPNSLRLAATLPAQGRALLPPAPASAPLAAPARRRCLPPARPAGPERRRRSAGPAGAICSRAQDCCRQRRKRKDGVRRESKEAWVQSREGGGGRRWGVVRDAVRAWLTGAAACQLSLSDAGGLNTHDSLICN